MLVSNVLQRGNEPSNRGFWAPETSYVGALAYLKVV